MSPCWTPWWVGSPRDESSHIYMATQTYFPRFLIVQSTDSTKPLQKMSPFLFKKCIESIAVTPKNVKYLRSGGIIIEMDKQTHVNNLLKQTMLDNYPVKISPHKSLNTCRGVIRCRELRDIDQQEILEELSSQHVSDVYKVSVMRDGRRNYTNTIFLTFNRPSLPDHVQIGFLHIKVSPYIPNPMRCFQCQRFGHFVKNCRRKPACCNCGSEDHQESECQEPPKCLNCKQNHAASSKECPIWKQEKEIQRLKSVNNISYPEAKKLIIPYQENTYASITNSTARFSVKTLDASTQTEIPPKQNQKDQRPSNIPRINRTEVTRRRKGEDDPILQYNKFAVLDVDEEVMEMTVSQSSPSRPPSSKKTKKNGGTVKSPIKAPP